MDDISFEWSERRTYLLTSNFSLVEKALLVAPSLQLKKILDDENWRFRVAAALRLVARGETAGDQVLRDSLLQSDEWLRQLVVSRVAQFTGSQ